jgi:hypothetical protein
MKEKFVTPKLEISRSQEEMQYFSKYITFSTLDLIINILNKENNFVVPHLWNHQ